MKAQELRIGNLVSNPLLSDLREIDHLDIRDFAEGRLIIPFEPIPLTEEWLLKFGFVKRGNMFSFTKSFQEINSLEIEMNGVFIHCCDEDLRKSDVHLNHIKYVHQLQNLYFCLTGEELKLSE